MLKIPSDLSGFKGQTFLATHRSEPAAQFAYESAQIGRATNSVTLLLVGLTGAGKSSVANMIFDAKVCEVGESQSTTKVIEELTVPMPSEDIQASNTKVIVVDTPGFGDTTQGATFDAQTVLAIRDTFRNKYIPNFVLLVANITDKRLGGSTSQFVRMLVAMKSSLLGTAVDDEKCNVVLVLTHLMSLKPSERKKENIEDKIQQVKKLVSQNLGLADVYACVAENECEDYELPKEGDFYKLPNGDLYPGNLLQQLILCSKQNGDKMGQALISEAIRRGAYFPKPQKRSTEIKTTTDASALTGELVKLPLGKESSEVRRLLRQRNETDGKYILDAETLGLELERCGITNVKDFPTKREDLMKLMKKLMPNSIGQELLSRTFGVQVPPLGIDLYLGHGYNVTKDQMSNTHSAILGTAKLSSIGCLLPGNVQAFVEPAANVFCKIVASQEEYIKCRLHDLHVSGTVSSVLGSLEFKHGYNLSQSGSLETLSAVYERVIYKLRLNSHDLGEDFKRSVQLLPTCFDQKDERNINAWRSFFDRYGTHFVHEVRLGGYIKLSFTGKAARAVASKITGGSLNVGSLFASLSLSGSESEHSSSSFTSSDARLEVRGGRSELLMNAKSPKEIDAQLPAWEASLHENPVVIDRVMALAENASLIEGFKPEVAPPFREALLYLYKNELKAIQEKAPTTRKEISEQGQAESKCLTGDTLISTPKGSVPISLLKPGDFVFSGTGAVVEVIGVNKIPFSAGSKLYGFGLNSKPFFNGQHPFLSPEGNLLVVNQDALESSHPQLGEIFTVKQMTLDRETLLGSDGVRSVPFEVSVEEHVTEEDMFLYFMAVTGDGTYVANGFVCYHEIPDFSAWPRTFSCILQVVSMLPDTPGADKEMETSLYARMHVLASKIGFAWANCRCPSLNQALTDETLVSERSLDVHLRKIIQDPVKMVLGQTLYVFQGRFLHQLLDVEGKDMMPLIEAAREVIGPLLIEDQ